MFKMINKFYLLKISLKHIEPAIWRRIVVPHNIRLDRLHEVIQIAMGWENYHLYEFDIAGVRCDDIGESGEIASNCFLFRLVKTPGETFNYLYDFGDYWEHEIVVEDIDYPMEESVAPQLCLDGARACPPEDVHGEPGYYDFCKAMKKRKGPAYREFFDWYGKDYDSEFFDCKAVSWKLTKYMVENPAF